MRTANPALRRHWSFLLFSVAVMALGLAVSTPPDTDGRTAGDERWFYATALLTAAAIIAGVVVMGKRTAVRHSSLPPEAKEQKRDALALLAIAPLYAAALLAGIAAYVTREQVNLFLLLPFFAFALYFYPQPPLTEES